MNIETIYESFVETYRNMGYIISELSQRTMARAANLARNAAPAARAASKKEGEKRDPNFKNQMALNFNAEKLERQAHKFKTAAREKGFDNEKKAFKRGGDAAKERANRVNMDIMRTGGLENQKDVRKSQKKAAKDATNVKRLRKRFKDELDGDL